MDPLSVTAGIIAVISAGGTFGKGLKKLISLRHAPNELRMLRSEVLDLQVLVKGVSDVARAHESITDTPLHPSACRALEKIKSTILALEKLIIYDLTTNVNSNGQTEITRLAWLRSQHKVQDLKEQIKSDKATLSVAFSVANV